MEVLLHHDVFVQTRRAGAHGERACTLRVPGALLPLATLLSRLCPQELVRPQPSDA